MPAVSTLILRSMRLTGEKARGATLTSSEQTECLEEFNTFMDSLSIERLNVYQVTQDSVALSASTSTYTIGVNGAISTARPIRIVDPCFVRDASGLDSPVLVINAENYGRIVQKNAGYTAPTHLFYDGGWSATSTGTIFLYPIPNGGLTLFINSWKPLGTFAALSTNVSFPPGYQEFIESNFAVRMIAGLGAASPELLKMARDTRAAIKSLNSPELLMRLDSGAAMNRQYGGNILTG